MSLIKGKLISMCAVVLGCMAAAAQNMPYYKLTPVPAGCVTLHDGLWASGQELAFGPAFEWVSLNFDRQNGGYAAFKHSTRRDTLKVEPVTSFESVKMLEAVGEYLKNHADPDMEAYMDRCVDHWITYQDKDGYFNGICTGGQQPAGKWNYLKWSHELYGVGHLLDAALSYAQSTGKDTMLKAALKAVDQVFARFGPDKVHDVDGHEQIERALTRYYEYTGDRRFLDTAAFFIDQRGNHTTRESYGEYSQDHAPFVCQHHVAGHAVRALYLYIAATDVVGAAGNEEYRASVDSLWHHLTSRHMYNTGAVGVAHSGIEGFAADYDIAPDDTYGETCAAIATGVWAQKLNRLYADASYIDVFETVIYNAFNSSLSRDGQGIYYCNHVNSNAPERRCWPNCPCCPGNILSHYARIPGYIYSTSPDGIYVNLFMANEADIPFGEGVMIRQQTNYPSDGRISLTVAPVAPSEFSIYLRIPQWANTFTASINGKAVRVAPERGYVKLTRRWMPDDRIELELPMIPERQYMDESFESYKGLVAVRRGPIVYTFEGTDNYGSVCNIVLPKGSRLKARRSNLLGGTVVVEANGLVLDWDGKWKQRTLTAIPGYLHSNRGTCVHYTWIAEDRSRAKAPVFHLDNLDLRPQQ